MMVQKGEVAAAAIQRATMLILQILDFTAAVVTFFNKLDCRTLIRVNLYIKLN